MFAATPLADARISPTLYREALALSHLARSIHSQACAVDPSCNVRRDALPKYGDDATWAWMARTYTKVAKAIGRHDLADKDLSLVTPAAAWTAIYNLVGSIQGMGDELRVTGVDVEDPFMAQYLDEGGGCGLLGGVMIGLGVAAAGLGAYTLATRRRL